MAGPGPILVIAGAGSGKTRALTYRVSRLVEDGVNPSDILLLTFTNKAAREMLARVEDLLSIDTRRIQGGTFHSIGNRLLRSHAEILGYQRNFSILDEEDAKEMMQASVSECGIKTLEMRFPKADVLLDIHSFVINTGTPFERHIEEQHPHFLVYSSEIRQVFGKYAEKKRIANAMDFDDLLVNWKRLLVDHPDISLSLQRTFRHILVDEYQDTNRLQAEIVDAMSAERRNLMVVGDDAQSIYSFRGASFENVITFPQRWSDAAIFKLETNYRSTPQILDLANAAIARNRYQFPKELSAVRPDGPRPAVVGVDDVFEQASFVAQRILELRDEGEELDDIAVLYRSHYQSLELQMELARRNIPYEIRSGVRFFEQAHIKDVLSYLKIIANSRDELSWKRAMKLYQKVGERTASSVWLAISTRPDPLASFLSGQIPGVARTSAKGLSDLRQTLGRLSGESMQRNPSESIRLIVEQGYADYARAKFANSQARLDDLEQLAQYALRYEDVQSFLADLSLTSTLTGEDVAVVGPEDERVVLSSIHQAKGLEWRNVFVIWLAEGRFPSARAMRVPGGIVRAKPGLLPAGLREHVEAAQGESSALRPEPDREIGFERAPDQTSDSADAEVEIVIPGEEEERRLFYVAVTRAKQELYLVYPAFTRDHYQMDVLMEPSRFLRELPEPTYEKWVIRSE